MLDKTAVREIASLYADEIHKILNPQSVIFFGSYVNGKPHEYSDIDIAVVFIDFQGNWLEISFYLVGLAWNIGGYIEPHLMDVTNKSERFLKTYFFVRPEWEMPITTSPRARFA